MSAIEHPAAEIRQDHLLVRRREDVGALGHEVDAAEDDEVGVRVLGDLARQLPRVAGVVGEADHFVALIVVAEDHEPSAQRGLRGRDAAIELLGRDRPR